MAPVCFATPFTPRFAPYQRSHLVPSLCPHVRPSATPARITMGIRGLTKLLSDNAASCITPLDNHALFGRKIAIDASMSIYQLLVAVRMGADNMTNSSGMVTSHISGLFYRTIRLLELGAKPVYVFDGKPPEMKAGELLKRADARKAAEEAMKKAQEEGDLQAAEKFQRRINRITPEMTESCKMLLKLMGVPIVEAPCEAEAQCAELVKNGDVFATVSEDMDSLTFGTTRLIRHLWQGTSSSAAKKGIKPTQFDLEVVLSELDLPMNHFIDLCILCGCDYVDSIKGVGPVKALKLIRQHGCLEKAVAHLRGEKSYTVPDEYPVDKIRSMFVTPEVTPASEITLKWSKPNADKLKAFLIDENQFDVVKVDNGLKRLTASRKKTNQGRLDSFFKRVTAPNEKERAAKRKAAAEEDKKKKKRPRILNAEAAKRRKSS